MNFKKLKLINKGITLIALVITIIVLLILAGVTIITLTGDNGILTKSDEASDNTKRSNIVELVKLAVATSIREDGKIDIEKLNDELQKIEGEKEGIPISSLPATIIIDGYEVYISENGTVTVSPPEGGDQTDEIPGVPDEDGFFTKTSTINGEEQNANNPKIPEGFRPVDTETSEWGNGTSAPTEENINKGLVIEDKKLNQFVWVPVNDYSKFVRRNGYHSGSLDSNFSYCGEANSSGTNNRFKESTTTQTEAAEIYKSIETNGGFYVGRYEAGKENEKVVIKQGAAVYNNVTWSKNGQMNEESEEIQENVDGTKDGAIELARNFDTENTYTDDVRSTLIYAVQWDAIMKWMEEEDIRNPNVEENPLYIQDSTGMGWYNNNYQTGNPTHQTGIDVDSNKSNCVNNIYDLAGNVYEWTMESYYATKRVVRGGTYLQVGLGNSAFIYPASSRHTNFFPYNSSDSTGFRVTLYLKSE